MGLLRSGDKKQEKAEVRQFQRDTVIAEASRPVYPGSKETQDALGEKLYYFMHPQVDIMILSNPHLRQLYIAFSYLMRLTNIGKDQADILAIKYRILLREAKMNMNEDEYERTDWGTLGSLDIYALSMVTDSVGGFKADVATREKKLIQTEIPEQKKKRWF